LFPVKVTLRPFTLFPGLYFAPGTVRFHCAGTGFLLS